MQHYVFDQALGKNRGPPQRARARAGSLVQLDALRAEVPEGPRMEGDGRGAGHLVGEFEETRVLVDLHQLVLLLEEVPGDLVQRFFVGLLRHHDEVPEVDVGGLARLARVGVGEATGRSRARAKRRDRNRLP